MPTNFSLSGELPNLPFINETAFAYQVGLGFTIPLSNTIKLDARYRYFATDVTVYNAF